MRRKRRRDDENRREVDIDIGGKGEGETQELWRMILVTYRGVRRNADDLLLERKDGSSRVETSKDPRELVVRFCSFKKRTGRLVRYASAMLKSRSESLPNEELTMRARLFQSSQHH